MRGTIQLLVTAPGHPFPKEYLEPVKGFYRDPLGRLPSIHPGEQLHWYDENGGFTTSRIQGVRKEDSNVYRIRTRNSLYEFVRAEEE